MAGYVVHGTSCSYLVPKTDIICHFLAGLEGGGCWTDQDTKRKVAIFVRHSK